MPDVGERKLPRGVLGNGSLAPGHASSAKVAVNARSRLVLPGCWNGRQRGLKSPGPQGRVGSNPTPGIGYTPSVMSRILFAPFRIVGSLIAGLVARKAFERLWSAIDDEEPPEAGEEREPLARVLLAAVLQATVFAVTRALFDRQARRAFRGLTGSWPGAKDKA